MWILALKFEAKDDNEILPVDLQPASKVQMRQLQVLLTGRTRMIEW